MDIRRMRGRVLGCALVAATLGALARPMVLQAQDQPAAAAEAAPAESLTDERLTQYAGLHRAIAEARDEFHQAKARVHDAEARERLREQMDERLHGLYEEHGMTKEEFDRITFLVSIDNELRTRFEEIQASLNATSDESERD